MVILTKMNVIKKKKKKWKLSYYEILFAAERVNLPHLWIQIQNRKRSVIRQLSVLQTQQKSTYSSISTFVSLSAYKNHKLNFKAIIWILCVSKSIMGSITSFVEEMHSLTINYIFSFLVFICLL